MGGLFSKSKKVSRVTEQDRAVLQMKSQRDKIKQYQKQIARKLETERRIAKELVAAGKKDRALLILRKKRLAEQLLSKTDGQLETIETLIQDVEFAQVEAKVFDVLKEGNEALKKVNDSMNIDEIEKIMDETKEAAEKQEEIQRLISGESFSDTDMEAIEKEFNDLVGERDGEQNRETEIPQNIKEDEPAPELPEVPTDEPVQKDVAVKDSKKQKIAIEAS
nr:PREDICTED: charged multivesicular body protein 6 [Bemisia tabaci]